MAAQWMGWQNIFSCEIDDFCNKVTKKHFPDCIQHGDIKTTDFTIYRGRIDILTGGFPCQPFSVAGKRKGTDDDRHLWPEMLRAVREIQPSYVVGENVRGIINWSRGMVFHQVQSDLETSGYEVLPFLLPACAVNAPHRRDRIWFVAHAISERTRQSSGGFNESRKLFSAPKREKDKQFNKSFKPSWSIANPKGRRFQKRDAKQLGESETHTDDRKFNSISEWSNFPTQPPVRLRDDGLSSRLDGITFPKWCYETITSAGNAIVPQVAFEIFKAIEQTSKKLNA